MPTYKWILPKDLFYQAAERLRQARLAAVRKDTLKLQQLEEQIRSMPGFPVESDHRDTIQLIERNPLTGVH